VLNLTCYLDRRWPVVTRRRAVRLENLCSVPDGDRIFSLHHLVQPALEPIQSFPRVPGLFPLRKSSRGVKLTTHLHVVPSLRMHGTIPPLYISSWRGA
jgi:hypothetical protein